MSIHKLCAAGLALALLTTLSLTPTLAEETLNRERSAVIERVGSEIKFLASDELGGRDVGTPGIEQAAEYIRGEFKRMGVKSGVEDGSYYQEFEVRGTRTVSEEDTALVITGPDGKEHQLELKGEFQPQMMGKEGPAEGELVFVGYGISADKLEYNEYADLDVEGKIVVMLRREPQQDDEESIFDGTENSTFALIRTKMSFANKAKAAAIIMVNDCYTAKDDKSDVLAAPGMFGAGSGGVPFAHVKQSVVNDILKVTPIKTESGKVLDNLQAISDEIDATLEPLSQPLEGWKASYKAKFQNETLIANNVIGIIEGEGPHADETIVIGGHYDHLGVGLFGARKANRIGEIHNGADDNATGTVAVVELARRFATAEKKPARRLVFIGFSAEERGLLGAKHYVNNPVVPLDKTVAMINFDMIGWLRKDALTIYGAGTSPQFEGVIEAAGVDTGLDLKPVSAGFAGSDHLPFQGKKIPAMFLHTGLTSTYHTPDDDYETINVEGAVRVIDYSENLINELANLEETPEFSAQPRRRRPRQGYLGAQINFSEDTMGLLVKSVTPDSPAAKAGLKTGDMVMAIGGEELKTREDLIKVLGANGPGTKIKITIKRGEESEEVEVELGRTPR